MCADPFDYGPAVGLCECGEVEVNEYGQAVEGCNWSPVVCEKCDYRPCDYSC